MSNLQDYSESYFDNLLQQNIEDLTADKKPADNEVPPKS